jgi:hypothetical protein
MGLPRWTGNGPGIVAESRNHAITQSPNFHPRHGQLTSTEKADHGERTNGKAEGGEQQTAAATDPSTADSNAHGAGLWHALTGREACSRGMP